MSKGTEAVLSFYAVSFTHARTAVTTNVYTGA